MLSDILIAASSFGVGFFIGVVCTASLFLKRYKQYPLQVIYLLEKYSDEY